MVFRYIGYDTSKAYVGLLKIGELKGDDGDNNTIFISAASGAVGSVACQIAKIKGFRVVGSVGSQEKVKWLLDQAGIDYAFNYKEVTFHKSKVMCLDLIIQIRYY